jgi:hypothetical protein
MPMIDQPAAGSWAQYVNGGSGEGRTCPAPDQNNECKDCRACWDAQFQTLHMVNTNADTKNNLIWYFIRSREQLPASYVRSCDKFFKSIGEKNVASSKILRRMEETEGAGASSVKQQA